MNKKLLIIEDDPYIMRALSSMLEIEGYTLDCVSTGADALSKARSDPPDLFLLDLGLPDMDGLQVIQQLRTQTRRPIIILSARTQENEKVLALDYGADDYVTKPFGAKELKARIRSALRHTYISQESESLARYRYICGTLTIDYQSERVFKNGKDVHLTNIEYQIVALISRSSGKVLTYQSIIASIWGPYADAENNRILRVNMANIRRKIEENPAAPKYIFTEVGVGYRMAPEKRPDISLIQTEEQKMFDLLIKNAYIFDGTGAEGFHSDIGIVSGKIAAMAQTINAQAKSIINASGLTLTPGFIDAHSHQDIIVEEYPECICAVEQGITTQIAGMCGDSAAPISPEHTADALRIISSLKGGALPSPVENRFSFGGYLEQIDKPIGTNMAFLVGHGMIRAAVMGFENRRPTAHEMEQMKAIVQQAMDGGAFGISFGLIYPPGSYCNADEMSELCKVVAQNDGVMTVHVRSESNGLIEAVEEMLGVVRSSGVRCVISHHKATGGSANWGKTAKTLDLIQKINAEGYDVFTDQYPYTASATGLATNIPDGMFTLGTDKLIAMLSSRDGREQLRPFILGKSSPKERFKYTMIGSSPSHPEYNGKMLNNIADELNIDPYELQCDILRDDRLLTGGIYHTMSEDDLKRVMQYRRTMIGTDGMWYPGCGGCHPRSIGTFPRVLGRYVREKQYISLSEAVRRMTSLPAQVYGLKSKGLIVNGYDADIVLFDAAKIIDHADYGSPYARCEGLEYVIVGGKIAAQNAVFTGIKAGRIIKSRRTFTSQSSNL